MNTKASTLFFSRRGFTLTELLAVIAIVGVLAAILIPVVGRAREAAAQSTCIANLRTLHQATGLYVADHAGTYPPTYGSMGVTTTAWWRELYPDYCSTKEAFMCPTDESGFSGSYKETLTRNGKTYPNGKVSYGTAGHVATDANGKKIDYKVMGKKAALFHRPSAAVLYTEQQHGDIRLGETWWGNKPRWPIEVTYPHAGGRANFVFLDGHVSTLTLEELYAAVADKSVTFNPAEGLGF